MDVGSIRNQNFVYMLRCGDGSLYTGWTTDLERRLRAHRSGKGGHYTKSHQPVQLAYYECAGTKQLAMQREYRIKQLTRAQKEDLIRQLPQERQQTIRDINRHAAQP